MRISKHVYDELTAGKDIISDWIKNYKKAIFTDTKDIQIIVSEIVNKYNYVYDSSSTTDIADPYVLAVAKHLGGTVITDEGNGYLNSFLKDNFDKIKEQPSKVKLNLICHHEKVPCLSLMQFFAQRSKGYNSE